MAVINLNISQVSGHTITPYQCIPSDVDGQLNWLIMIIKMINSKKYSLYASFSGHGIERYSVGGAMAVEDDKIGLPLQDANSPVLEKCFLKWAWRLREGE
ncbi:hypothetical protein ACTXT7_011414 [Hymenolepis weldensis]